MKGRRGALKERARRIVKMKGPHPAFGWRIHCGVEVIELSTNKQHTLSTQLQTQTQTRRSSTDVAGRGVTSIGVRSSGNVCGDEEYVQGEAIAQSTTLAYTRVDKPAGLLDLPAVCLQ